VRLAALPSSPAAKRLDAAQPDLAVQLATGGDEYELLFAAPAEAGAAIGRLSAELGLPITEIGAIESGDGVRLVDPSGNPIPVANTGWRHF
jgi:thiamine-monophosphate kinase